MAQARIGDTRDCKRCDTTFTRTHGRQVYCSEACRLPQHRKITTTCTSCGVPCDKQATDADRYPNTYCSPLCRSYHQWGPRSSKLPVDHWARWFGATSTWTPPIMRNTGTCSWCGQPNDRHLSAAYCTDQCKFRAKRARRRAAQHQAPGEYTWTQVIALWARLGKTCAYCAITVALDDVDPDHVVPLSRGGHNSIGNILPSCRACNSDKRDLLLEEWAADRNRRNLPARNTAWTPEALTDAHRRDTLDLVA